MTFNYIRTSVSKDKSRIILAIILILLTLLFRFVAPLNDVLSLLNGVYDFFNDFFWIVLILMGVGTLVSVFIVKDKYKSVEISHETITFHYLNDRTEIFPIKEAKLTKLGGRNDWDLDFIKNGKSVRLYDGDWENFDLLIQKLKSLNN